MRSVRGESFDVEKMKIDCVVGFGPITRNAAAKTFVCGSFRLSAGVLGEFKVQPCVISMWINLSKENFPGNTVPGLKCVNCSICLWVKTIDCTVESVQLHINFFFVFVLSICSCFTHVCKKNVCKKKFYKILIIPFLHLFVKTFIKLNYPNLPPITR